MTLDQRMSYHGLAGSAKPWCRGALNRGPWIKDDLDGGPQMLNGALTSRSDLILRLQNTHKLSPSPGVNSIILFFPTSSNWLLFVGQSSFGLVSNILRGLYAPPSGWTPTLKTVSFCSPSPPCTRWWQPSKRKKEMVFAVSHDKKSQI